MRAIRLILLAVSLVPAQGAWGAFEDQNRQQPLAGPASAAGAFGATALGLEALTHNPAGLGYGEHGLLVFSGGGGGREADYSLAGGLLLPIQDDLSLALGWRELGGVGGPGFGESSYTLGVAFTPWTGWSLGLRPTLQQARGGSGTTLGLSMDAGLGVLLLKRRAWSVEVGYWTSELVSEWPDRHWHAAVPITQHGGLGLRVPRWGSLGLSWEQASLADRELPPIWRLGAHWERWPQVRFSAGASGDPAAAFSAGLGLPFRLWRIPWEVAYAGIFSREGGEMRQRLQVTASFRTRRRHAILAVPLAVEYEPGTKRIRKATVSLNVADESDVRSWELEIRDRQGRLLRVIRGEGVPPALLTWDGRDALGEALEDVGELHYQLHIKTGSGLRSSETSLGLESSIQTSGLEAAALDDSRTLVVPVLGADGRVAHLSLRPPAVPGEAKRWQIVIQDDAGRTLQTLSGEGPLPATLNWDGREVGGLEALTQKGLRVRFNVWDKEEHFNSVEQSLGSGLTPVVEEEAALPRLGLKLPAFREGGPALALLLSDRSLRPLPVEASKTEAGLSPSFRPTAIPTIRPTAVPTMQPTAVPTIRPTAVPTMRPTAVPTMQPTAVPTARPTAVPTARPTLASTRKPTPWSAASRGSVPSVPVTSSPTRIPRRSVDSTRLADVAELGAGLRPARYLDSPALLPPAYMTREEAEASRLGRRSRSIPGKPRALPQRIDGVLDVFVPGSADIDPNKADRLQAFYWRLRAYRWHRLQLTGLVGEDEPGGEALSRARVREFSRRLVEEGAFAGEFILKVDGERGPEKGVRVEVLRR